MSLLDLSMAKLESLIEGLRFKMSILDLSMAKLESLVEGSRFKMAPPNCEQVRSKRAEAFRKLYLCQEIFNENLKPKTYPK